VFAIHADKMTLAVFLDGLPLGGLILRKAVEADLMNTDCEGSESEHKGEPQLCLSREGAPAGLVRDHFA
jgi:hypothetical protein